MWWMYPIIIIIIINMMQNQIIDKNIHIICNFLISYN